ncbi:MAG: hypothetical protein Q8P67_17770, partial [archaeon]|nr:hypothetical protein [archaeon]
MSSVWFNSPERFGLEDDEDPLDSPPIDIGELRSQVQSVFQAQLNKEAPYSHSIWPDDPTFEQLFFKDDSPSQLSMPPEALSFASVSPPAPPAPPAPGPGSKRYNPAYQGSPAGLYPYATSAPAVSAHYAPYLPEDIIQPSFQPCFQPSAGMNPSLMGSSAISQIPNPFMQAHGHTPKAGPFLHLRTESMEVPCQPVTARKLAAAARPRNANGKFVPKSKQIKDHADSILIVTSPPIPSTAFKPSTYSSPSLPTQVYNSPQTYTSPTYTTSPYAHPAHLGQLSYSSPNLPNSPELLEAHVATL